MKRENGATKFVPGSHKEDSKRVPKVEEVTYAGGFKHDALLVCRTDEVQK